jgi:hypothetical protein
MFELAQTLAIAKSRQDVAAAMEVLHPDILLETPAFGTMARGAAKNERVLTRFLRVVSGLRRHPARPCQQP